MDCEEMFLVGSLPRVPLLSKAGFVLSARLCVFRAYDKIRSIKTARKNL
jgi:hypothetical protein